jgi:hypothetical protein
MDTKVRQKPIAYDVYRGTKDPTLRLATMPGAGLPSHSSKKDWQLMSQHTAQHLHTDAPKDIGVRGYCFFRVVKGA